MPLPARVMRPGKGSEPSRSTGDCVSANVPNEGAAPTGTTLEIKADQARADARFAQQCGNSGLGDAAPERGDIDRPGTKPSIWPRRSSPACHLAAEVTPFVPPDPGLIPTRASSHTCFAEKPLLPRQDWPTLTQSPDRGIQARQALIRLDTLINFRSDEGHLVGTQRLQPHDETV